MSAHLAALRRMAGANDAALPERAPEQGSTFNRNMLALLERTEYRRCDTGEDLEDIYRLRYRSYRLSDMVPPNERQIVHDALDEAPNCHRFGIFIDGTMVSTLRLHHVTDANETSPSMMVYGDLLAPAVADGASFADPSRFAADPEWSRVFPQIPYLTLRLAAMACFHFDAPYCLATIREEHSAFYRRIFSSECIGELRSYPGLNYPVVLYRANVLAIQNQFFARFPFFRSTAVEQRLLFTPPGKGRLAPLTVLPTARFFHAAA